MKKYLPLAILMVMLYGCRKHTRQPVLNAQAIEMVIHQMSMVMIHDVTNPPLASRFFAYSCLAGYEVVSENDRQLKNMHNVLNQYPALKNAGGISVYDYKLSAILAMYETAAKLQPSGATLLKHEEARFVDSCFRTGFDAETIDNSVDYARQVSKSILAYAKADSYNRTTTYKRYTPSGEAGAWDPTPPLYLSPVEPYFNTIRPFTLTSASQFLPAPPIPFSTKKTSSFYQYLRLSYEASGNRLTQEQKNIANFWDCNPFAVQATGHMLVGLKKISPGAHWMAIAGIACKQAGFSFSRTMEIHTVLALTLMDGFICCWDDKYRTNRIRPETAIRKYLDPEWKPLLQTPPFPEYISGHSVISAASAVILTHYFGDNFAYIDDVEKGFGIPPRHFDSFKQAAKQAAISRFWGGIHFMDAIDNGVKQGAAVGGWVLFKYTGIQVPASRF